VILDYHEPYPRPLPLRIREGEYKLLINCLSFPYCLREGEGGRVKKKIRFSSI
jgi:hypothetical protein